VQISANRTRMVGVMRFIGRACSERRRGNG
jgi:hypothetical protein